MQRTRNSGSVDFWAKHCEPAAMPSPSDVRKIALALDGVSEIDHWGRPAYRTIKRIFAVMRPDGLYLNLAQERKDFLFEADGDAFVKTMWGKTAHVLVQIGKISKAELETLIREAWEHNKPEPRKVKLKGEKKSSAERASKKIQGRRKR